MRGKSYLSLGNMSMGIVGSQVDPAFFERFLGMRVEHVDMVEFARRIEKSIFDDEEFRRAMSWVKTNCREGKDHNPPDMQMSREQKQKAWEWSVKMALIGRDLMVGNPRLEAIG